MKTRLQVNVSGGRTSAYMAWWLKQNMSHVYDFLFIFANTGFEHPDTYRFLRAVDENFDLGLILVEAEVQFGKRKSSEARVVTHDTLSRDGRPFEDVIKKYGVPSNNFPHCTREMKARTINAYTRAHWGTEDYERAVGIRVDESRRVSPSAMKQRIIYPLVDMAPTTKDEVVDWFKQFPWDLAIPEYLGNCITCYKKSKAKLNAVWWDDPNHFKFFSRMEEEYGHIKPAQYKDRDARLTFFRDHHSAKTLTAEFKHLNNDNRHRYKRDEEDNGVCSESCEPFEMIKP